MTRGIIAYFARNRIAANLLMLFFIIGGLVSALELPIQNFPKLDPRTINVTIPSPGSTPEEIEEDINRRIEESIIGLSGVERVISEARQGLGVITINLETFSDSGAVLDNVTNAINSIHRFPPPSAERPEIELIKTKIGVLTLAMSSESATENELRLFAEQVQAELLALPEISEQVNLNGVRDREITIELDEAQLQRHQLTFPEVASSINSASLNLSFGELNTKSADIVLHTISKRTTGEEFENIPLIHKLDGSIITLGDVATITDGFADYQVYSRLNGLPAVFAVITAQDEQSIVETREAVQNWLENRSFPKHFEVTVLNDHAKSAVSQIGKVLSNSLIGLVIVFLCLVAVFDLRLATWVTVGIPLSFIGSFLFFGAADLTINLSTIFAFFLMIGIVVDDAVVVGENIETTRKKGKNALDAAIDGAREVVGPVTIGAITTAIAFIPLLFLTEGAQQALVAFPYVVFFVLLVSLIEAFLILPAHLSYEKRWSLSPLREFQTRVSQALDDFKGRVVVPIVSIAVRHVVLTPIVGIVVVVLSFLLLGTGVVRFVMGDQSRNFTDSIGAEISMPVGTPFHVTLSEAQRIAKAAELLDDQLDGDSIKSISVIVGTPSGSVLAVGRTEGDTDTVSARNHLASVRIHLNDQSIRKYSAAEIEAAWRDNITQSLSIQKLEFQASRFRALPNVAYSLQHEDRELLKSAATEFRSMLENLEGLYGLTDNMSLGKRHIEIELTPEGTLAGLTPASLGAQLRARLHGLEVQRLQRDQEEIKVVVRYPRSEREHLSVLSSLRVRQASGRDIPLSEIAQITETRELATLNRINGKNAAFVEGFADVAIATPNQIRKRISESYIPILLDRYPELNVVTEGGIRNEQKTLKMLATLVPLVLLAMYAIVAAFLRSYWKPLVIVFGVPVAAAGAIISHLILGWDFTIISICGVIGVSGVIVNDALVLLDRYNSMRRNKPDLPAIAVASAAMQQRFRPVFLTSLTTIVGLSPLLYERSEELLNLIPFVVSMLGGLIFASLFTLFIVPTLVMLVEGYKE